MFMQKQKKHVCTPQGRKFPALCFIESKKDRWFNKLWCLGWNKIKKGLFYDVWCVYQLIFKLQLNNNFLFYIWWYRKKNERLVLNKAKALKILGNWFLFSTPLFAAFLFNFKYKNLLSAFFYISERNQFFFLFSIALTIRT